MKDKLIFFAFLCLLASLAGCGPLHISPLEKEETIVDLENNGIILLSAQETQNGGAPYVVRFDFQNLATGDQYASSTGQLDIGLNRMTSDLDYLEGIRGRVTAYELPPGEYAFNDWLINNGTGMTLTPRNPRIAKFTVDRGKAKYIGSLNMILDTGENFIGVTIVSGGFPIVEDQFDRDVPIAKQKFPPLRSMEFEKDLIQYETQ